MAFDLCEHQKTQIIIKAAKLRRKELGMSVENNITVLHDEMAPLLGVVPKQMNSGEADHLPSPYEMTTPDKESSNELRTTLARKLIEQKQNCPKCGKQKSMELHDLCRSCDDFKAGWRSEWRCIGIRDKNGMKIIEPGCGHRELTKKFITQWISEFGKKDPEFADLLEKAGMLSKKEMGIPTVTDEGIK
jgi:hypothetical protein